LKHLPLLWQSAQGSLAPQLVEVLEIYGEAKSQANNRRDLAASLKNPQGYVWTSLHFEADEPGLLPRNVGGTGRLQTAAQRKIQWRKCNASSSQPGGKEVTQRPDTRLIEGEMPTCHAKRGAVLHS